MDFYAAFMIDEAQPSNLIHKIADMLPGRTHHLSQRFLAYLRKDTLDAIHLASALAVGSTIPGVELLSLDDRIRRAGEQLGFRLQPS